MSFEKTWIKAKGSDTVLARRPLDAVGPGTKNQSWWLLMYIYDKAHDVIFETRR